MLDEKMSPLMQGRGLKPKERVKYRTFYKSPLMQGRGLKLELLPGEFGNFAVAPYAGAWIETHIPHPHPGHTGVAPYAGAWIETRIP